MGNDCDLAVLRISDPAFMKGLRPLALGDVPRSGSRVQTYGFPLGGQDVSSTAGIVSRVESRGYVHSGIDAHLVVQTDAAINPGNSGGPVVQEGRVVGVAFQGYPGFDNMGFFIPVPVVRHFLADLEDGQYDGFPDSGLQTTPLLSPVYRRERGCPRAGAASWWTSSRPAGPRTEWSSRGTCSWPSTASRWRTTGASVPGDARVTFEHLLDLKQTGQPVRLTVWRDGRQQELTAVSRRIPRLDNRRNRYGVAPRYVVYAGLVFVPLDTELMKTFGRGWPQSADRNLVWHHLFREAEQPETADREVVVLIRILRHAANAQVTFGGPAVVQSINGVTLRGLGDVVTAFSGNHERFHRLEFEGTSGIEAIDRAKADAAHPVILQAVRDRSRPESLT